MAVLLIAALLGGSIGIAQGQDPVIPRLMVQPHTLAINLPTLQAPFTIAPRDRSVFTMMLDAPGTVRAEAAWSGDGRLALILNGPGQTGYYAREDGGSPLALSFEVTDELLNRGAQWTLSVVKFGSGQPATGTLSITLPRAVPSPAEPARRADDAPIPRPSNERELVGPNRFVPLREIAPGTVLINQPELLENGSMRFRLPNGLIGQLSPSDTLTIVDPEYPDSTQTIMLRSTNVQHIDPPDPPDELLSATGDLNTWWGLMQLWMNGMNERMRLSLEQAFSPTSMEQFETVEANAEIDSPFERADYRLRYLENVLVTLLAQTAADDAPPPN